MTIIGQRSRGRRRPLGPIILGLLAAALVAFLALAYANGGEQPQQRIEKPVRLEPARR